MEKQTKISLTNIITTLLGIVLASPILGFFSVMWNKANRVDDLKDQLQLQKAAQEQIIEQLTTVKSKIKFLEGEGPYQDEIPADIWLEQKEEIQQKIDKSIYRAKN